MLKLGRAATSAALVAWPHALIFLIIYFFALLTTAQPFGRKSDICGSWNNFCNGGPASPNTGNRNKGDGNDLRTTPDGSGWYCRARANNGAWGWGESESQERANTLAITQCQSFSRGRACSITSCSLGGGKNPGAPAYSKPREDTPTAPRRASPAQAPKQHLGRTVDHAKILKLEREREHQKELDKAERERKAREAQLERERQTLAATQRRLAAAVKRGDYRTAVAVQAELVDANKHDPKLWLDFATYLEKSGQLDDAATAFRRSASLAGKDASPLVAAMYQRDAAARAANGDFLKAISQQAMAVEADKNNAGLWRGLADYMEKNGQLDNAAVALRRAHMLGAPNPEDKIFAMYEKQAAELKLRQQTEISNLRSQSAPRDRTYTKKGFLESADLWSAYTQKYPNDPVGHMEFGRRLAQAVMMSDSDPALVRRSLDAINTALRLDAHNGETKRVAAVIVALDNRLADALVLAEQAAKAEPTRQADLFTMYQFIARRALAENRPSLLREAIQKAEPYQAAHSDGNKRLKAVASGYVEAAMARRDIEETIAALRLLNRIAPGSAELHAAQGAVFMAGGRLEEGKTLFTRAMAQSDPGDRIVIAQSYSQALFKARDWRGVVETERELRAAVVASGTTTGPDRNNSVIRESIAQQKLGNDGEALAFIENFSALRNTGEAKSKALHAIAQHVEQIPGGRDLAIAIYKRALALSPGNQETQKSITELQSGRPRQIDPSGSKNVAISQQPTSSVTVSGGALERAKDAHSICGQTGILFDRGSGGTTGSSEKCPTLGAIPILIGRAVNPPESPRWQDSVPSVVTNTQQWKDLSRERGDREAELKQAEQSLDRLEKVSKESKQPTPVVSPELAKSRQEFVSAQSKLEAVDEKMGKYAFEKMVRFTIDMSEKPEVSGAPTNDGNRAPPEETGTQSTASGSSQVGRDSDKPTGQ